MTPNWWKRRAQIHELAVELLKSAPINTTIAECMKRAEDILATREQPVKEKR